MVGVSEALDMTTKEQVIEVLKGINDPELYMDIYTLELIRELRIEDDGTVYIKMTFTSPMCPYGPQLLDEVQVKVKNLEGVKEVKIDLDFNPPWQPSPELRATLGV